MMVMLLRCLCRAGLSNALPATMLYTYTYLQYIHVLEINYIAIEAIRFTTGCYCTVGRQRGDNNGCGRLGWEIKGEI